MYLSLLSTGFGNARNVTLNHQTHARIEQSMSPVGGSLGNTDVTRMGVPSEIRKFIFVPERCLRSGLLCAEAGQGLPPFPCTLQSGFQVR